MSKSSRHRLRGFQPASGLLPALYHIAQPGQPQKLAMLGDRGGDLGLEVLVGEILLVHGFQMLMGRQAPLNRE